MSESLKQAEEIARKLKLELQGLTQEEALELFHSRIDEIPEEYRGLVDGWVAATLVYGHTAEGKERARPVPFVSNLPKIGRRKLVSIAVLGVIVFAAVSVLPVDRTETEPSGRDELRELRADGRNNLLVFVHGIRDDGNETWTNADTNANWPDMIRSDPRFDDFDLSTYHYSSSLFFNGNLSISNIADQLAFRLDRELIDSYNSIVFVAHSMGGLVVRNLLIKNDRIARKVPLIYFLATPSAGSDIAKLGTSLGLESRQLDALTSFERSNFLQDQNSAWRASEVLSRIYSLCAFESRRTLGVIVVDQASAQSLCTGVTVPSGETHSGIARPHSQGSIVYEAFADRVDELF